jgi:hypothetical protein
MEQHFKEDKKFWYCVSKLDETPCPEGKYKVVDADNKKTCV